MYYYMINSYITYNKYITCIYSNLLLYQVSIDMYQL